MPTNKTKNPTNQLNERPSKLRISRQILPRKQSKQAEIQSVNTGDRKTDNEMEEERSIGMEVKEEMQLVSGS